MSHRSGLPLHVFRGLLSCYPAAFRHEFGAEMCATFEADLADARRHGTAAAAWLVVRTLLQIPLFGLAERLRRLPGPAAGVRIAHDVRAGVRQVIRRPKASAAAIGILAVGLAAATISFSVLRGTVLKGLPFERADELVHFERRQADRNLAVTPHDYLDWRAQQTSFEDLAAYVEALAFIDVGDAAPARHEGVLIEPQAFRLLRRDAALGRVLVRMDVEPVAHPVILLSDALWRSAFGADPDVVNRPILVNGVPTFVVGVMPPRFGFPIAEAFWVPLRVRATGESRASGRIDVFGRLAPGVTFDDAAREFEVISGRLAAMFPENRDITADLKTFHAEYIGEEFTDRVWTLLACGVLVLVVASVNVAGLLVARQAARRGDTAVRMALGATRTRLLALSLGEAGALSVCGGAVGTALASAGTAWLRRAWHQIGVFDLPHGAAGLFWWDIRLDAAALLFVAACLTGTTLIAAALSAVRPGRHTALRALDAAGRTRVAAPGRLAGRLVVGQVALATCLVLPVVLAAQSATGLQSAIEPFARADLLTARVALPADPVTFARRLDRALAEAPALAGAAVATVLPFHRGSATTVVSGLAPTAEPQRVRIVTVSRDYFALLGVAPVAGRLFGAEESPGGQPAVLINESLSARLFPGAPALGQRIRLGEGSSLWRTVVGVVPDLWIDGEQNRNPWGAYIPLAQEPGEDASWLAGRWGSVVAIAQARGGPIEAERAVRAAAERIQAATAVFAVDTLGEVVGRRVSRFRVFGAVYAVLGVIAMALATAGIYALNALTVALRRPEIGVRLALGATSRAVYRTALGRSLLQIGSGVAAGLVGAFWVAGALAQTFFHVDPYQPVAYLVTTMVVLTVGLVACLGPARRASRVDPLTVLRTE